MNLESTIARFAPLFRGNSADRVFMAPGIPPRKLTGAIAAYAHGISPDDILLLVDDSAFGGAGHGFIVTWHRLLGHDGEANSVSVEVCNLRSASFRREVLNMKSPLSRPALFNTKVEVNGSRFVTLCRVGQNERKLLEQFLAALVEAALGVSDLEPAVQSEMGRLAQQAAQLGNAPSGPWNCDRCGAPGSGADRCCNYCNAPRS